MVPNFPAGPRCAGGEVLGEFYNQGYQYVNNFGYSSAQKKTRSVRARHAEGLLLSNPLPYDYATNGGLAIDLDDLWSPVGVERAKVLATIFF